MLRNILKPLVLLGFFVSVCSTTSARPPFNVTPYLANGLFLSPSLTASYTGTTTTTGSGILIIDAGLNGRWEYEFSGGRFKNQGDTVLLAKTVSGAHNPTVMFRLRWTDNGVTDSITFVNTDVTHPVVPGVSGGAVYYEFRELIPLSLSRPMASTRPTLHSLFYYDIVGRRIGIFAGRLSSHAP